MGSLTSLGVRPSLRFLGEISGFRIGETAIEYDRESSFSRAILVGFLNTIKVGFVGILLATVLGVAVGIAKLSSNELTSRVAGFYVEMFRNIPLLVLLIFLKIGVFNNLPVVREALHLPGPTYISNRGVAFPWGAPTDTWPTYSVILVLGVLLAIVVAVILRRRARASGRPQLTFVWTLATAVAVALIGWGVLAPATLTIPELGRFNIEGGLTLSPEFLALWLGLSLFTSAFIAEAVRAGIQAVPKGQVEAARALGLSGFRTMQLVVFPQGLRVMIPPTINQYLNLIKNSSLAAAIGYPELFNISGTILNQTGRALEVIAIMMVIYLALSLITSGILNWYNQKVRLIEH